MFENELLILFLGFGCVYGIFGLTVFLGEFFEKVPDRVLQEKVEGLGKRGR